MEDEPQQVVALRQVLQQRQRKSLSMPGFRAAAVLVPLCFSRAMPLSLLLTVRHSDLPTHPGQVAFPGGKRDPDDPSLEHTALREAREELGLDPAHVRPMGLLDDVLTPAGFVITPVVAAVSGPLALAPNEREVVEVFFVPVSLLPEIYRQGQVREYMGVKFVMHEYLYEERRIWGATAAMIGQLLALLPKD